MAENHIPTGAHSRVRELRLNDDFENGWKMAGETVTCVAEGYMDVFCDKSIRADQREVACHCARGVLQVQLAMEPISIDEAD
jgi:hypothetical protein